MEVKHYWDNSKLIDYLRFDYWHAESALWVLAGFNYPNIEDYDVEDYIKNIDQFTNPKWDDVLDPKAFDHYTHEEKLADFKRMRATYERLHAFLQKSQKGFDQEEDETDKYYSPAYFIDWAISKGIQPDWLDWAIDKGLYKQKSASELPAQTSILQSFDKNSPTYPPELDWAWQAWQAISATTGKGKPKERTRAWLKDNAPNLSKDAIERIATVVNWDKLGGATRSD